MVVLLKIGGSLLTDKTRPETFRPNTARRLLREAALSRAPLIIVHGAGSFGHPAAVRHRIGARKTENADRGVVEVLGLVQRLNAQVVELAVVSGLSAVSVPLHSVVESRDGVLHGLPVIVLSQLVERGFVPVVSGTLVQDDRTGWRVLGGDEIVAVLAETLRPERVLFATDVEGVYDRDPKSHPEAMLLERLAAATQITGGGEGDDVTGRMAGKLGWALQAAKVAPTQVVSGLVSGRLREALEGRPVPGTHLG